ncbi:phage tail protein [Lactiplantibacillus plantarum]|uniref:phage tail protein n=1 Tax=Lactiplantibacillus plantarum TaxID=1590 RepID=UPI001F483932|nr:phage tail protein [Lactiplantibacillus plantarum]
MLRFIKYQIASQAASSAAIVASQATSTGNNASQVASQAASAAKQASADYTALSAGVEDGSVVHITTKTVIDAAVIGTAEIADAAITDAKIGNISATHITTGSIDASKVTVAKLDAGNITTGTLSTDRLNVGKLSPLSANLGDVTTGSLKGVDIVANTFSTPNGSFTTDANGNVVASNLTIRGVTNLVYNAALLGNSGTYPNTKVPGWNLFTKGYYSNATLHDGVPSIGFNSSTGSGIWVMFAQSKLYPLNGLTGQPYSTSVWFIDAGSDTAMTYQVTLAFFDSSGNRLPSGNYTSVRVSGTGSAQPWQQLTINGFNAPSTAVYVGLQYWAYNGTGHALFSSPMLTQTAQSTGYQPDTGNVVSAGEIDGSVINGSTINGTTFNAGDIISSTYNTSRFYPTTITPAGLVATTGFNSMDGLRTEMSAGSFVTKYRAVHSSSNQYEAYDGVFSGDELALNSGFTNGIDTGFQQSVSGNQLTGQVVLSPLNGIHLWGSTQSIHFSGLQMNGTGITFNSYGNIIADQASTWWRVTNFSGSDIANFGTDTAGSNVIQFNRELDIGNFQINTGHTFTSADSQAIHFAMGKGGAADIYAGAVNYTSLVKSSLLSVKKDVKKADTAYWAQLVNSIDLATYQYKTDDNTSHIRLSSIVDDVNDTKQWQLPDVFISRDENGKLSGVDDSVLLNATLATVQEQQKQISALNGHLLKLEAKLNG